MSTSRRVLLAFICLQIATVGHMPIAAQTDDDSCLTAAPEFEFMARIERGVYRWDDRSELSHFRLPSALENTYRSGAAAWSSDGTRVAVILADGTIVLWGVP